MKQSTVHTYAKSLYEQMGPKSEAYVAQKIAAQHADKETGGELDADTINWSRVRDALQVIRASE
ncbi:hypothetical protein GCM10017044_02200 [Kordiimonas sediminis]|uniref:Uncharacterized protein n=1 Tax=Kordiimonas sediminis TaxID=1735581 RepID=A0A919AJ48_9PROT|nr:hypothetical protein [Kordiimonas sediminis]GHF11901.1 hypothetical protein GCM10017044_02200 [Kordiimonas sediminis]